MEAIRSKIDAFLQQDNYVTQAINIVEEKTKVPKIYLIYGFIGFIVLYLLFGYGGQFLANFIGFIYPAYCSIKAVESKEKDDDTKWLTYWVVYAAFGLVETFTDILLFWIPFYAFFKCAFLIYLFAPTSFNGSVTIYSKIIKPNFLKHEKQIDQVVNKAGDYARDTAENLQAKLD